MLLKGQKQNNNEKRAKNTGLLSLNKFEIPINFSLVYQSSKSRDYKRQKSHTLFSSVALALIVSFRITTSSNGDSTPPSLHVILLIFSLSSSPSSLSYCDCARTFSLSSKFSLYDHIFTFLFRRFFGFLGFQNQRFLPGNVSLFHVFFRV